LPITCHLIYLQRNKIKHTENIKYFNGCFIANNKVRKIPGDNMCLNSNRIKEAKRSCCFCSNEYYIKDYSYNNTVPWVNNKYLKLISETG
jgi:hypothetical protein